MIPTEYKTHITVLKKYLKHYKKRTQNHTELLAIARLDRHTMLAEDSICRPSMQSTQN